MSIVVLFKVKLADLHTAKDLVQQWLTFEVVGSFPMSFDCPPKPTDETS